MGQILRRARSGRIIVKLFVEVKEGTTLYSRNGRIVGVVREVFGPVRSPYASLEARTDRVGGMIGEQVYAEA
ncbi:MAG: H/ACA ribonucleoprotein complex subunit GAR1 [Conexivisphaera sp.]